MKKQINKYSNNSFTLLLLMTSISLLFIVLLNSHIMNILSVLDFNLFSSSAILNSIIGLILGIIVYLNNRESKMHKIWMLFSLCISIWSFGLGMMAGSSDKYYSFLWGKILFGGAIFIPITHVHFTLLFLNKEDQYKKLIKICYLFSAFFFITNFTNYFIAETRPILTFKYWTKAGILMYPFTLMFLGLVFLGIVESIKSYKEASGIYRSQIQYLLLSFVIGYGGGITNFLPTYDIHIYPSGNYFVPFYYALVAYAIVKYRFMDIDIVYKKGTVYSAGLFVILAPTFLLILWLQRLYFGSVNSPFSIALLAVVAVSAIAFYYLKFRTEQALENTLFYKNIIHIKFLVTLQRKWYQL